ncbi:MAG: molybdenum cofactor biosynthesis protein MoaE [Betaproteobacteria bacterium]|nr:molybdenum cofactor biosynthesis protein MoaE [Betaproteobacteria bacterium]
MTVRVQTGDFDAGAEIATLRRGDAKIGAVAAFIGLVRDINDGAQVKSMTLEHYPGMTERSLEHIVLDAKSRFRVEHALVIHRVGELLPADQIVLVVTAGGHRGDVFSACEYIMDYLKTEAPFWKKEQSMEGARWVASRQSDEEAAARWTPKVD